MTQIRLDQVDFSTLHEAPKNYDNGSVDIVISGSVANLTGVEFIGTISYARDGTRADLYLDGNGVKVPANAGDRATAKAYSYSSTEVFSSQIAYYPTHIAVTLTVFNGTGATVVLNNQTITASAVLIDAPIGSL